MNKYLDLFYHLYFKQYISKIYDFPVKIKIGDFTVLAPLSHKLPLYKHIYPQYDENVVRICEIVNGKYKNLSVIDVGANIGDTAVRISSSINIPILCIEGDKIFFDYLKKNTETFDNIEIYKAFVGSEGKAIEGVLTSSGGTARLTRDKTHIVKSRSLDTILQMKKNFSDSKFIKSDTEGYDIKILANSINYIRRARPVVFFEYDPFLTVGSVKENLSFLGRMKTLGYKKLIVFTNVGDYLLSLDLDDGNSVDDINDYFSGRNTRLYADLCAFHEEDLDVFEKVRLGEKKYFRMLRNF